MLPAWRLSDTTANVLQRPVPPQTIIISATPSTVVTLISASNLRPLANHPFCRLLTMSPRRELAAMPAPAVLVTGLASREVVQCQLTPTVRAKPAHGRARILPLAPQGSAKRHGLEGVSCVTKKIYFNINASFTYSSNFLFLAYDCRSDIVAECPTPSFLFFFLRMIPSVLGPKISL